MAGLTGSDAALGAGAVVFGSALSVADGAAGAGALAGAGAGASSCAVVGGSVRIAA
jgi:hypothetical protein